MKRIEVSGLNIDRLILAMQENNIMPQKLKRISHEKLEIEISNNEYKKLVDLKLYSCYNKTVTKRKSDYPLLYLLVSRIGILIGLVISLSGLWVSSKKIASIDIVCINSSLGETKAQVEEVLETNNVVIGNTLNIKTKDLEREIVSKIDDLSSVVVSKNGTSLTIELSKRVKKQDLSTEDIVSNYDGKITSISHSSGILMVNVGEGVSKGQILIKSGTVGDFYSEAKGEIKAKVYVTGEAVGSTNSVVSKRTGNFKTVSYYELFGKRLAKKDAIGILQAEYGSSEVELETKYLFKNLILPLKLVTARVYELVDELVVVEQNEVIERLKNEAKQRATKNLPIGAENIGESFDVFEDNGLIKVICLIKTEISIGMRKSNEN